MKPSRHGGPYRVGVLGGGQLGRMLALAAAPLGIRVIALDPGGASSPTGQVSPGTLAGSFTDPAAIRELAAMVDVLTVEIEHVDATALSNAAAAAGIPAHPSPATITLIQDKYLQKEAMAKRGVPLGKFKGVGSEEELLAAVKEFGFPAMVKSRLGAYDGRGNFAVHKEEDVGAAWRALNRVGGGGLFVEAWVPFVRELSVIVVKGTDGSLAAYPPVHTIQKDSICHLVFAPCGPTPGVAAGAGAAAAATTSHGSSSSSTGAAPPTISITVPSQSPSQVALGAVGGLEGAGVYGVELFELLGGGCLLNEIAPRVHNSGHYSTEGAKCSQFEQHIRAVCGLPLGPTALRVPAAAMVNILASGGEGEGVLPPLALAALSHPGGASLHWYSKGGVSKAGRKVGHITITGGSVGEVRRSVDALLLTAGGGTGSSGSGSGSGSSTPPLPPVVGIVMGSDSDLGCMGGAAEVLKAFGVPFELTLVSAHRTPGRLEEYGRGARAKGLKVIIAGAGGAAHLPGMLASITPLPVIGVPVPLKHLDGVDSLYSILQMPKGVPVATMAIGNAANAGLMAVRILGGGGEEGLLDKMEEYQRKMEGEVLEKAEKLERLGWEAYLKEKK